MITLIIPVVRNYGLWLTSTRRHISGHNGNTKMFLFEYPNIVNIQGDDKMANLAKYRYTTGPISISEFINNIRILVLNNGAKKHKARVRIFNLDPKPKKEVFDETFTITANSKIQTEFIPMFNAFEVQILTDSPRILIWVGGRSGNENLEGNIILHKDLVRF